MGWVNNLVSIESIISRSIGQLIATIRRARPDVLAEYQKESYSPISEKLPESIAKLLELNLGVDWNGKQYKGWYTWFLSVQLNIN